MDRFPAAARAWMMPLLLSMLGACTQPGEKPPEALQPLSWSVEQPGPYRVGFMSWELSYTPAGSSQSRIIPLSIWYPTEDLSGAATTYEFVFNDEDSWQNATAAPAAHADGYPVLVYSHGNQGFAGSSAFLMRSFASHGWVALAPDHIGNTLTTHSSPRPLALWLNRSLDLSAALDELSGRAPELLGEAVDSSQVLVTGHSFGAHTTWASSGGLFDRQRIEDRCEAGEFPAEQCTGELLDAFAAGGRDPRFIAGAPLAGKGSEEWFGSNGLNAVSLPMLQMSGSADAGAVEGVWDRSEQVDLTWIDIEGGCHQLFALGACDQVPSEEGFHIVSTYALAFARHQVLGDHSTEVLSLLDGSRLLSPRVSLQRR